jgi:hypothetical protein
MESRVVYTVEMNSWYPPLKLKKHDLSERHHRVEGGLHGGLEKLAGVVVEEETPRDHRGKHYNAPENAPVKDQCKQMLYIQ